MVKQWTHIKIRTATKDKILALKTVDKGTVDELVNRLADDELKLYQSCKVI